MQDIFKSFLNDISDLNRDCDILDADSAYYKSGRNQQFEKLLLKMKRKAMLPVGKQDFIVTSRSQINVVMGSRKCGIKTLLNIIKNLNRKIQQQKRQNNQQNAKTKEQSVQKSPNLSQKNRRIKCIANKKVRIIGLEGFNGAADFCSKYTQKHLEFLRTRPQKIFLFYKEHPKELKEILQILHGVEVQAQIRVVKTCCDKGYRNNVELTDQLLQHKKWLLKYNLIEGFEGIWGISSLKDIQFKDNKTVIEMMTVGDSHDSKEDTSHK